MEPSRKRVRHEISAESDENDDTVQSQENPLDSSIYLTYDILRIVFQYLSSRDLANAAIVCRSWSEAANSEKWTRGPQCFLQECEAQGNFSCIKNARVKPFLGFFFIDPYSLPYNIDERILSHLPDNCEAIMLHSSGIILNNREMEDADAYQKMVCAFLPQIPSVKMKAFRIIEGALIETQSNYQRLIDMIETCAPDHKTCVMLFCDNPGYNTVMDLATNIQKSNGNGVVSLWGGAVDQLFIDDAHNCIKNKNKKYCSLDDSYCVAVLITGPIQTWSTIVDRKCKTKEQVEARLRLFKDQVKLQKHSVGFMFSCRARGMSMYQDERNVESSIFKSLFPKVPLVGCFGNGEFGKNTIPVDDVNEKKSEPVSKSKRRKMKLRKTSWYNEFSTVFMILTYG